MTGDFKQTYERRVEMARQRIQFGMTPEMISKGDFADVIRIKNYLGLSSNQKVLLLPVFDEVKFSKNGVVAFCRIAKLWNLFDARSGKEIFSQSLPDLPIYHEIHHTLELVSEEHHHGLYDLLGKQLLLEAEFDEVDCCAAYSHLWVRKGDRWGYVNKTTQKETLVFDMSMAYEADGGLFLRYGDKIICVDENGAADTQALRRFVLKGHGRGVVRNAKYHETVYFDIYGNILQ